MNKLPAIIVISIFAIISFVKGYNFLFKTEKEVDKYLSSRTELKRKLDDILSMSTREDQIFWTRVSGVGAMFFAILFTVMIFLIIFGILIPAE